MKLVSGDKSMPVGKERRKRGRKPRSSAKPLASEPKSVVTVTSKRVIRPTTKALESPICRKFFATPRLAPIMEEAGTGNAIKVTKKGDLVVEVPSRMALNTESNTKIVPHKVKQGKVPVQSTADDDSKRMPAPVALAPVKKTRAVRAKRAVRLYSEPKPVPKDVDVVPKYRQELEKQEVASRTLRRKGSALGDDDIYNFHPSQEVVDEPAEQDDSYIKTLIERLKKRKKRAKKVEGKKTSEEAVETLGHTTRVQNKTEAVMKRIRERLSEKHPTRSSLRKSGPELDSSNQREKTVTFELPDISESLAQENVPLAKSPSTNIQHGSIILSPASRDISMLPPMTSPVVDSPNLSSNRIIRDPVPGTSTGGWTTSGTHSTPNQRPSNSRPFLNTSFNRSPHQSTLNRSINSATSPWRVNDEPRVPRTKYFSFSKDLLPSYSSDVIVQDTIPFVPDRVSTSADHSLNHSDAENVAPGPRLRRSETKTAPEKERVPLSALEVLPMSEKHQPVTQSPLVRHSVTAGLRQMETQLRIQIISNVTVTGQRYRLSGDRLVVQQEQQLNSSESDFSANSNVSDCFGFDMSSAIDDEKDIPETEISVTDLKEKLQQLKQVLPLEKSVSQNIEMPVLFKSPVKQTNTLKTMFESNVSTQVQQKKSEATFNGDSSDSSDFEISDPSKLKEVQSENGRIKLFDDPEDLRVKQVPVVSTLKSFLKPKLSNCFF